MARRKSLGSWVLFLFGLLSLLRGSLGMSTAEPKTWALVSLVSGVVLTALGWFALWTERRQQRLQNRSQ